MIPADPEFDFTVVHPNTYPMVQRILGGPETPRMIEFNYRGWEPESARADGTMGPRPLAMGWHPDGVPGPGGKLEARASPSRTP